MNQQGTEGWHLDRCGKLTASRFDAVMAEGRGGKPSATREDYMAEIIAERLTGQPYPDGFTSWDMKRGIEKEPDLKLAVEAETGMIITNVGCIDHPMIPWTAASPDGLIGEGLLEGKCPKTKTHLAYLRAGVPPAEYIPQMTWQIACTGRPWCLFVSFDDRLPEDLQLFMVKFVPEPALIARMESEAIKFLAEVDERVAQLKKYRAVQK